jgi:Asp-tRNA(Asn)/Glu-tRNA(Gln) amidotransferase A subunit family amidase
MLILLVDIAGYRTTSGRKRNDALFPVLDKSDWPVQKWEEAGGIVLGKLNMHEIGADTTNNNPNWGTPKNPHNDQYYTGGSSGGAATAVSSGLIPVALGTDGGGSIRIPASFCGIYGLKPSHARLGHGGSTVTVAGPLAASIAALRLLTVFCFRRIHQIQPLHYLHLLDRFLVAIQRSLVSTELGSTELIHLSCLSAVQQ